MVIFARVISKINGSAEPSRCTVSTTTVPAGPSTRRSTRLGSTPITSSPSTAITWSPGFKPTSSAGDPGMGVTTVSNSPFVSTQAPMPSYSPSSGAFACWYSWGSMYPVCSSPRESNIPRMAPCISKTSSTG